MKASQPLIKTQICLSVHSLFQLAYRRVVVTDAREQLCKDFCITTNCGCFLILASQTPQQTQAVPPPQQTQQQEGIPEGLPGVPCIQSTTFHVVRIVLS